MDHQRHAAALTDDAVGEEIARDIAEALAVDPSPDFLARVRMRIASEPERGPFAALKGRATFGMWRRASALRWTLAVAAVMLVLAVVLLNRPRAPIAGAPLAARALRAVPTTPPYVASGLSRTTAGPLKGGRHVRIDSTVGPPEGGPHVRVLLDPRETQALRSLLADIRTNRVDLSALLTATAPAPTDLPPASDLVITPLAIEPLAPTVGAEGERQ